MEQRPLRLGDIVDDYCPRERRLTNHAIVVMVGDEVHRVGPGDFFGELSVLDGHPRNAQVAAVGPCRCLAIASWDLEALLSQSPALALAIIRGLAARLRASAEQATH